MIKVENVKVFPLHNENFNVLNTKEELATMLSSGYIMIIVNYDYDKRKGRFEDSQIVGFIPSKQDIFEQDGFLVSDVYFNKDICPNYDKLKFKNYEVMVDDDIVEEDGRKITKICCIIFSEGE